MPAIENLQTAVRMAREVGQEASYPATYLSLAKLRSGEVANAHNEAERLSVRPHETALLPIARLWHELGEREKAVEHALRAHHWAVADGEPYVRRFELEQAHALLEELGEEPPEVPRYDPSKDEKIPWEDDALALLEELRAKKRAQEAKKDRPPKRRRRKPPSP